MEPSIANLANADHDMCQNSVLAAGFADPPVCATTKFKGLNLDRLPVHPLICCFVYKRDCRL